MWGQASNRVQLRPVPLKPECGTEVLRGRASAGLRPEACPHACLGMVLEVPTVWPGSHIGVASVVSWPQGLRQRPSAHRGHHNQRRPGGRFPGNEHRPLPCRLRSTVRGFPRGNSMDDVGHLRYERSRRFAPLAAFRPLPQRTRRWIPRWPRRLANRTSIR
jgi:hypothetical protein